MKLLEQFKSIRVDLLMTDIRMPGMDGLSLVRIVEKEWPDCLTVFLTGHSEFEYAKTGRERQDDRICAEAGWGTEPLKK